MYYDLSYPIREVAPYINWLYFFHAWGFPPRFASIAKVHGCTACQQNWVQTFPAEEQNRAREAMQHYFEAQHLLRALDAVYHTHARIGLFEAHSEGDDIVLHQVPSSSPEGSPRDIRLPFLRQQHPDKEGNCWCLSDFVHPAHDRVGVFVSTVDAEMEQQALDDDYQHLLYQTLADRLAEATIEKAHETVRKELWGYAPEEKLSIEDLFAERYQGRRPAVGYPSIPDQSMNFLLSEVLDFPSVGVHLTESGAMRPHASTSGIILGHPATRHFGVGRVGEDQLQDYARRRGVEVDYLRRFFPS